MPTPRNGESKTAWMKRCYTYFTEVENKDWKPERVIAVCNSIWDQNKGVNTQSKSDNEVSNLFKYIDNLDIDNL